MIVLDCRAFFPGDNTAMAELTSLREQLKDLKTRNETLRGYL